MNIKILYCPFNPTILEIKTHQNRNECNKENSIYDKQIGVYHNEIKFTKTFDAVIFVFQNVKGPN